MPYVQLPREQTVQIFYEFFGEAPYDPVKPTVLVLSGPWSDSSLVTQRFLPSLNEVTGAYNCLVLDLRGHGRTVSEPMKEIDCWIHAADIAFVLNAIQVPAVHLVSHSLVSGQAIFAFAILFPSQTLSLSALGAANLYAPPSLLPGIMELMENWLQDDDPEAFMESLDEAVYFNTSHLLSADEADWLAAMWSRRYGPANALKAFEVTAPLVAVRTASPFSFLHLADVAHHQNPGMTKKDISKIVAPVLFVVGTADVTKSLPVAEELVEDLTASVDVSLHIVEGGAAVVGITHLDKVRPLITSFLFKHSTPSSVPPPFSFPAALSTLTARSSPSPPPAALDPLDARSYSRVQPNDDLRNGVWELCQQLDGKAFCTWASAVPECWEDGGRLADVLEMKWRFSQRNANDVSASERRGSLPLTDFALATVEDSTSTTVTTTTLCSGGSPAPSADSGELPTDSVFAQIREKAARGEL
ncbi:hypothetical protein JCM1840_003578 [Sporobolomyces johnsonii]